MATAMANLNVDDGEQSQETILPIPDEAMEEVLNRVGSLSYAIYKRDLQASEEKLKSLKELEGSCWCAMNCLFKQDLQWEICEASLILSVLKGDRDTFTSLLPVLKKFYTNSMATYYPSPREITMTRLNLVKALLLDEKSFPAEVDFLVEAHWGIFYKAPFDLRVFKASDVVNFLLPELTGSMDACGSQSPPNDLLHYIIQLCDEKLNVYINKNSLPWEMDKGLLVSTGEESLKHVRQRHVINEALTYLVATETWTKANDVPAAVFDNLYSSVAGRISFLK